VDGGPGDDYLKGSRWDETLIGGDGNDVIEARRGTNTIVGGLGDDQLYGAGEDDNIDGGPGHDWIEARGGTNEVHGGPGNDTISSSGSSRLFGDSGDDRIFSSFNMFDQYLVGGPGDDLIWSHKGDDTLIGGEGKDVIYGSWGSDSIDGGPGDDTLSGQQDDDTIRGGDGDDLIMGWGGEDSLWGDGDDDTLQGGAGNDAVHGGDGTDLVVGGSDDDVLYGGPGTDTVNGRDGDDELNGADGEDLLKGGPGNDKLLGGPGNDVVNGADGNDMLWGNDGSDLLRGHAGDDLLDGGDGTDTLDGGADIDECTNGETYIRCEGAVTDPEPEVVVIEDGFEGYSPGTYPSSGGWYVEWSGREAFVSDDYARTGSNSFRLSGYGGWVRTDALVVDLDRAERLSYEVAVYCVSGDVNCAEVGFFVRTKPNESWPFNAFLFTEDHKILVKGTGWRIGGPPTEYVDTGLQWVHGRWYQIRAELDYQAETMSAWIDGNLVAEGVIPAPPDATEIFELSTHYGSKVGIVYYDDVRIEVTNTRS